ncbi:MAG: hypothetical protein H0V67_06925 [Geodermatophilaceae bacterium]|nr:hypothetical protein [Geodermatophilaceae bacterium]
MTSGSESTPAATGDVGTSVDEGEAGRAQAGRGAQTRPATGAETGWQTAGPPVPPASPVRQWSHDLRQAAGEVATSARLALVLFLAGIPVGVAWWLLAPRRAYEVTADGAFAVVPDSEAAVASDGWLLLLTGLLALVAAAVAWRQEAQRGPLMAVGLAIGMLACGLLSLLVGALLGPGPSAAALEETGAVVLGPLGLRAYGVLVVGPILAVAGYLLAVCFTPRDDLRAPGRQQAAPGDPPLSIG